MSRTGAETTDTAKPFLILVVEDVPMIHDVISRTLRDLDAEYAFAKDGVKALEEIESSLPDLIILDLALPILDGWEVLRRLQANKRTAQIPVLVITAHGESGTEGEVLGLGANAFLAKPFQPKELRSAAYELLGLT